MQQVKPEHTTAAPSCSITVQGLQYNRVCMFYRNLPRGGGSPVTEQGIVSGATGGLCRVMLDQPLGIWSQHAVLRQQRDLGAEHGVHGVAVQHACKHAAISARALQLHKRLRWCPDGCTLAGHQHMLLMYRL